MIIYKYLPPDGALKTIENNSVLLRTPVEFNDPYDCKYFVSKRELKRSFKLYVNYQWFKALHHLLLVQNKTPVRYVALAKITKQNIKSLVPIVIKNKRYKFQLDLLASYKLGKIILKKSDSEWKDEFEKTMKEVFEKVRRIPLVSCFSTKSDSILMWSHYAKDHTGACIEYEINDKDYKAVRYYRRVHTFKLSKVLEYVFGSEFAGEEVDYESGSFQYLLKPIFEKCRIWNYEKEIRCVFSKTKRNEHIYEKDHMIFLSMQPIRRIIIGCQAKEEFVRKVETLCPNVKITRTDIVEGKYKVRELD